MDNWNKRKRSEVYHGRDQIRQKFTNEVDEKKMRFSPASFRDRIRGRECIQALQEFLRLHNDINQNCVLDFLKSGGSCMELFLLLETNDANYLYTLVLEVVHIIILKVLSQYRQYTEETNEACYYFLKTYMTLINKMLSISSSTMEKRVILKLLAAIASVSSALAKEILLNVKFHTNNLEKLTEFCEESDGTRNAFINFLLAFLMDSHHAIISMLLENKFLLASVTNGLQFDTADVVCKFLKYLKKFILLNPSISKTIKMKLFNTQVGKDIVNLYNWKGPRGYDPKKKQKRKDVEVDEHDKFKVNECVQDFLLVLCTSHKFGVAFRDKACCLSKKSQNALLFSILKDLERPWEHSYASELVVKMCSNCPDLTPTVWRMLKLYLTPRGTKKWLNAVNFFKRLLEEMKPSCVEYCIKDFTTMQIAQCIQYLTAPTQILQVLVLEKNDYDFSTTKFYVISLFVDILNSVNLYLEVARSWLTDSNWQVLHNMMFEHVKRNFPSVEFILKDWAKFNTDEMVNGFEKVTAFDYLSKAFDLFELYKTFNSELVKDVSANINFSDIFSKMPTEENKNIVDFKVKIIKLYLEHSKDLFLPSNDIFSSVLTELFQSYFYFKNMKAKSALNTIFYNTGIFDNSESEINIWLDAIFDLENMDDAVLALITEMVKCCYKNLKKYKKELYSYSNSESNIDGNNENLENCAISNQQCKLSPLFVTLLDKLKDITVKDKSVTLYTNFIAVNLFHTENSATTILTILKDKQCEQVLSKNVLNYMISWTQESEATILKKRGKIEIFSNFSLAVVSGHKFSHFLESTEENINMYQVVLPNLAQMVTFYVTHFSLGEGLKEDTLKLFTESISFIVDKCCDKDKILKIIFENVTFIHLFSPWSSGGKTNAINCTKFLIHVLHITKKLKYLETLAAVLAPYRSQLFNALKKSIKKYLKQNSTMSNGDFLNAVLIFDFTYKECYEALELISNMDSIGLIDKEGTFSISYNVLNYILERLTTLTSSSTDPNLNLGKISYNISDKLAYLNNYTPVLDTSKLSYNFRNYLTKFPLSKIPMSSELTFSENSLFESILLKTEYCKESSLLATHLLNRNPMLLEILHNNISIASKKKGLILPLIEVCISLKPTQSIFTKMYAHVEPILQKSLQKPQKAGELWDMYYEGVAYLIKEFMPISDCKVFVEKVQKFESTEIFHMYLLKTIYIKALSSKEDFKEKPINNAILNLIHLESGLLKNKNKETIHWEKVEKTSQIISQFLKHIREDPLHTSISFNQVLKNGTFKVFLKLCLKFGVSECKALLKLLLCLLELLKFTEEDCTLLFDMIFSHSEFLDVVLVEEHCCKDDLMELIYNICFRFPNLLNKRHVPVFLSSYNATMKRSDLILYELLKLCAVHPGQTSFYDFKPFLWGRAAAIHYSVRSQIDNALWRRPRMVNVMDILQEELVMNTIKSYPLHITFDLEKLESCKLLDENAGKDIYDLRFLYQVFNLLLSHENLVQEHSFLVSGALSLTLGGLSCENECIRAAAYSVIGRFYYHIEARTKGKDNPLWLTFLKTVLSEEKLNNHAAIFFGRMAMILTQPQHLLYPRLSQYLAAKEQPVLSGIPELYTLLHSSEVNYKEHQKFILEIIRDGLRTDQDFQVAAHCMTFKLILELYSSRVIDFETRLLILEVINNACKLHNGAKLLSYSFSLLSFIYMSLKNLKSHDSTLCLIFIEIINNLMLNVQDTKCLDLPLINIILSDVITIHKEHFNSNQLHSFSTYVASMCKKYPVLLPNGML